MSVHSSVRVVSGMVWISLVHCWVSLGALLLSGALLLGDGVGHILALLLGGAVSLVMAHLVVLGVTLLLGNLLHGVGALLLHGGGALLLRHLPGLGGTLLLGGGDALLPGLCPGLGHADGGALGVGHCVALSVRDRVVHSLAQGAGRIVATVAVGAVSSMAPARVSFGIGIGITQSQGQQTNQSKELHTDDNYTNTTAYF